MPAPRRSARVASREEPASKKAKTEDSNESSNEIEIGSSLPELTLLDENENEVEISKLGEKSRFVVIFTYPKASTGGCTKQAKGFAAQKEDFAQLDASVYGLSADSPKSQNTFVTKSELNFPLLSDPKRDFIGLLGAKKSPLGVKRSHFIFDGGKLVVKRIQVSPEESFTSALDEVRNLSQGESETKDETEPKHEDESKSLGPAAAKEEQDAEAEDSFVNPDDVLPDDEEEKPEEDNEYSEDKDGDAEEEDEAPEEDDVSGDEESAEAELEGGEAPEEPPVDDMDDNEEPAVADDNE